MQRNNEGKAGGGGGLTDKGATEAQELRVTGEGESWKPGLHRAIDMARDESVEMSRS